MAHSSSRTTKVCGNRKESLKWIPCLRKQHGVGISAPLPIAVRRRQLQWIPRRHGFSRHFTRCQMALCCVPFLCVPPERETQAYLPLRDRQSRLKIILQPRLTIVFQRGTLSRERMCLTAELFGILTSLRTSGQDMIHAGNFLPCTNLTPSAPVL